MKDERKKKASRTRIIVIGAVIVLIVGAVVALRPKEKPAYEIAVAKRGTVVQEVSVTGKVTPITGADAAFEESGTVSSVSVSVGSVVAKGQELTRLAPHDLYAELDKARAALAAEEADLADLQQGATAQEIAVKRAAVTEAEQDLENAYESVIATVHNAYGAGDNAVRTETAALFDSSYHLTYSVCNDSLRSSVEGARTGFETTLYQWAASINALNASSTRDELSEALALSRNNLIAVSGFLNDMSDTLVIGCSLSATSVSTYRASIDDARTSVSAALAAVDTLKQKIALKDAAVAEAQRELDDTAAPPTVAAVQAQEAAVEQAAAAVRAASAAVAKTVLAAPFAGTVTKVNVKQGDAVAAYAPLITIVGSKGFEVKADIAEVDVANVRVGETARVTLDAYGDGVVFDATVASIDTSETVIEGVPTYETTLYFAKPDERIRSGMTANMDILAARKENVVLIPYRAVTRVDGDRFVKLIQPDGTLKQTPVTLGIRGSDGTVEIISGVAEGDKVATVLTP